jgi:hypothetical protein
MSKVLADAVKRVKQEKEQGGIYIQSEDDSRSSLTNWARWSKS